MTQPYRTYTQIGHGASVTPEVLADLKRRWNAVQPYLARELVPGETIAQPLAEYFATLVDAAPLLFEMAERQLALERHRE